MSTASPAATTYGEAVAALCARRAGGSPRTTGRIRALCTELGNPQHAFPCVHITGTNGKTTVARMVEALLTAHGFRVGTFTSPHLLDVRERIRVAGHPVPARVFVERLQALWPLLERIGLEHGDVTFFETLVALAMTHFADAGVDTGVIEVGIGGTHDATSVVNARVAVLTPVALDHPQLGSTTTEIAHEKAGIITPGCTVVSAPQAPDVAAVIREVGRDRGARVITLGQDVGVRGRASVPGGQSVDLRTPGCDLPAVLVPLPGPHQAANAGCALAAVEAMLDGRVDPVAVRAGFAMVGVPGRLERIDRPVGVPVWLDGAHNPAAAEALATSLALDPAAGRRAVVLGARADKDVAGMVAALAPVADAVVATTAPTSRAMAANDIAAIVRAHGLPATVQPDLPEALASADRLAGRSGLVVVTGSLYLVAAARQLLDVA